MSEERKKKSGAAWKAEEDEKLNKAFVELTEYIANEVENDTHFFLLAELHIKLYSLHIQRHTRCSPTIVSVLQVRLVPQSPACCFCSASTCLFLFSSLLFLTWT